MLQIEIKTFEVSTHYGLWYSTLCIHEKTHGDKDEESSSSDDDDHHHKKHKKGITLRLIQNCFIRIILSLIQSRDEYTSGAGKLNCIGSLSMIRWSEVQGVCNVS